LLELKDIRAAYGATPVLHGISLRADASSFLGLVGRNGVGIRRRCAASSG